MTRSCGFVLALIVLCLHSASAADCNIIIHTKFAAIKSFLEFDYDANDLLYRYLPQGQTYSIKVVYTKDITKGLSQAYKDQGYVIRSYFSHILGWYKLYTNQNDPVGCFPFVDRSEYFAPAKPAPLLGFDDVRSVFSLDEFNADRTTNAIDMIAKEKPFGDPWPQLAPDYYSNGAAAFRGKNADAAVDEIIDSYYQRTTKRIVKPETTYEWGHRIAKSYTGTKVITEARGNLVLMSWVTNQVMEVQESWIARFMERSSYCDRGVAGVDGTTSLGITTTVSRYGSLDTGLIGRKLSYTIGLFTFADTTVLPSRCADLTARYALNDLAPSAVPGKTSFPLHLIYTGQVQKPSDATDTWLRWFRYWNRRLMVYTLPFRDSNWNPQWNRCARCNDEQPLTCGVYIPKCSPDAGAPPAALPFRSGFSAVDLWTAATQGHSSATTSDGLVLDNPYLPDFTDNGTVLHTVNMKRSDCRDCLGETPVSNTIAATTTIFGLFNVTFYDHRDANFTCNNTAAVYQTATVGTAFNLAQLVPEFEGTPLDVTLKQVRFVYQTCQFESTLPIGFSLIFYLEFDDASDLLKNSTDLAQHLFGAPIQGLNFTASYQGIFNWSMPLSLDGAGFTLEAVLDFKPTNLTESVKFKSVGISFQAIPVVGLVPSPYEYSFTFFGDLNLDIPSAITDLDLDFSITVDSDGVSLGCSTDEWKEPFGISGLVVTPARFSAHFDLEDISNLAFFILAGFETENVTLVLEGEFSSSSFYLSGEIHNFTLDGLEQMFEKITGDKLQHVHNDVTFDSISCSIGTGTGLALQGSVTVDDYTSASASLQFSRTGISVQGAISDVSFDHVTVHSAQISISYQGESNGKSSTFQLNGNVTVDKVEVAVGVFFDKDTTQTPPSTQWGIYGEVRANISVHEIVPELKGTLVDFDINNLALLVVSGSSSPSFGSSFNPLNYPLNSGIHLCGRLGLIDAIDSVSKGPQRGLIFDAEYSSSATPKFSLTIQTAQDTSIDLGKGVKTRPIELKIGILPPTLQLVAGVDVPVSGQAPLDFQLVLTIGATGAEGAGQMVGMWQNPLGLHGISFGDLALQIGIDYAVFISTGLPSRFGFSGALSVEEFQAQVAVEIEEDPTQELFMAAVQNLDVGQLISFAERIFNLGDILPTPPEDFFIINSAGLYMCDGGVYIGTQYYPPGVSFEANITLMQHTVEASINISNSQVRASGFIQGFRAGPLSVHGANNTPNALFDFAFGPSDQHVFIDGEVKLFDADVSILVNASILPEPKFFFNTSFQFDDVFYVDLTAEMIGSISDIKHADLSKFDFLVSAEMDQNVIDHLVKMVEHQLNVITTKIVHGEQEAGNALAKARQDADSKRIAANSTLLDATRVFAKFNNDVHAALSNFTSFYNKTLGDLSADLKKAADKVSDASNKLFGVKKQWEQAIHDAEQHVIDTMKKWDKEIQNKEADLRNLQAKFDADYGDADKSIERAKHKVDSINADIDSIQYKINSKRDEGNKHHYKRVYLDPEIAALKVKQEAYVAARDIAQGALDLAEDLVNAAWYVTDKGLIKGAEDALSGAQKLGDDALKLANKTLDDVMKAGDDAIGDAQKFLDDVAKVFNESAKAVDKFRNESLGKLQKYEKDVENVLDSAEYHALKAATDLYNAAERAYSDVLATGEGLVKVAEKAAWKADYLLNQAAQGAIPFEILSIHLNASLRDLLLHGKFDATIRYKVFGKEKTGHLKLGTSSSSKRADPDAITSTAALAQHLYGKTWSVVESACASTQITLPFTETSTLVGVATKNASAIAPQLSNATGIAYTLMGEGRFIAATICQSTPAFLSRLLLIKGDLCDSSSIVMADSCTITTNLQLGVKYTLYVTGTYPYTSPVGDYTLLVLYVCTPQCNIYTQDCVNGVCVPKPLSNAAIGKTANQSSLLSIDFPGSYAFDGNPASYTHTQIEESPWIEVSLAQSYRVLQIVLWPSKLYPTFLNNSDLLFFSNSALIQAFNLNSVGFTSANPATFYVPFATPISRVRVQKHAGISQLSVGDIGVIVDYNECSVNPCPAGAICNNMVDNRGSPVCQCNSSQLFYSPNYGCIDLFPIFSSDAQIYYNCTTRFPLQCKGDAQCKGVNSPSLGMTCVCPWSKRYVPEVGCVAFMNNEALRRIVTATGTVIGTQLSSLATDGDYSTWAGYTQGSNSDNTLTISLDPLVPIYGVIIYPPIGTGYVPTSPVSTLEVTNATSTMTFTFNTLKSSDERKQFWFDPVSATSVRLSLPSGTLAIGEIEIYSDVNECLANNGGCHASATCVNQRGPEVPLCKCASGGEYVSAGVACYDVNDCRRNNGGCHTNSLCYNPPVAEADDVIRVCLCAPGETYDSLYGCTVTNACLINNGGCDSHATCIANLTYGTRTCSCNAGYHAVGSTCEALNYTVWWGHSPSRGGNSSRWQSVTETFYTYLNRSSIAALNENFGDVAQYTVKYLAILWGAPNGGYGAALIVEKSSFNPPARTRHLPSVFNDTNHILAAYFGIGYYTPPGEPLVPNSNLVDVTKTVRKLLATSSPTFTVTRALFDSNSSAAANSLHLVVFYHDGTSDQAQENKNITLVKDQCNARAGGCHTNAACVTDALSPPCKCSAGYSGNGVTCIDVNECLVNNGNCHINATCTNTLGSRQCECKKWTFGDGLTCTAQKYHGWWGVSKANGGTSSSWVNVSPQLRAVNRYYPITIDKLGDPAPRIPKQVMVLWAVTYADVGGGYCASFKNENGTMDPGAVVPLSAYHTSTHPILAAFFGDAGYADFYSGYPEDVTAKVRSISTYYNPTVVVDRASFGHPQKTYTAPSLLVFYNDGTADLAAEGKSIVLQRDECSANVGGCGPNSVCDPNPNNPPCKCNPGFTKSGANCIDIDECKTLNGGCSANAQCTNLPGTYNCTCKPWYYGNGIVCQQSGYLAYWGAPASRGASKSQWQDKSYEVISRESAGNVYTGNNTLPDVAVEFPKALAVLWRDSGSYGAAVILEGETFYHPSVRAQVVQPPASSTPPILAAYFGNGYFTTSTAHPNIPSNLVDVTNTLKNHAANIALVLRVNASIFGLTDLAGTQQLVVFYSDGTVDMADENSTIILQKDSCNRFGGGCSANAQCTPDNEVSLPCKCNTGYQGNGVSCTDVNECASGNGGCNKHATCKNTVGSFECLCNPGFTGNGFSCQSLNYTVWWGLPPGKSGNALQWVDRSEFFHRNATGRGGQSVLVGSNLFGEVAPNNLKTVALLWGISNTSYGAGFIDDNFSLLIPTNAKPLPATPVDPHPILAAFYGYGYINNPSQQNNLVDVTTKLKRIATTFVKFQVSASLFGLPVPDKPARLMVFYSDGSSDVADSDTFITIHKDVCNAHGGGCGKFAECDRSTDPSVPPCKCKAGFTGDGIQCKDVNECATNNGGCGVHSTCTNTEGSFKCSCSGGYSGTAPDCSRLKYTAWWGLSPAKDTDKTAPRWVDVSSKLQSLESQRVIDVNTTIFGEVALGYQKTMVIMWGTSTGFKYALIHENGKFTFPADATLLPTFPSNTQYIVGGYYGNQWTQSSTTMVDVTATLRTMVKTTLAIDELNSAVFGLDEAPDFQQLVVFYSDGSADVCDEGSDMILRKDACNANSGGCGQNAHCDTSPETPPCVCNTGYAGNGLICTDIDECEVNNGGCHLSADCVNQVNAPPLCLCPTGYAYYSDAVGCVCNLYKDAGIPPVPSSEQLVVNGGFETGTIVHPNNHNGFRVVSSAEAGGGCGDYVVKVDSGISNSYVQQLIKISSVIPQELILSGWSKGSSVSGGGASDYSVQMLASYYDGTLDVVSALFQPGTTSWTFSNKSLSPTKPIQLIGMYFLFRYGHSGSAYFDELSLQIKCPPGHQSTPQGCKLSPTTCSQKPTGFELIPDGGFESGVLPPANGFTMVSTSESGGCGAYSVKSTNANGRTNNYVQIIFGVGSVTPSAIVVSGWSKAVNVTGGAPSEYAISLVLAYADDTIEYPYIAFPAGTSEWNYQSFTIVPTKPIQVIGAYYLFRYGWTGTAYFDNLSMKLRCPINYVPRASGCVPK